VDRKIDRRRCKEVAKGFWDMKILIEECLFNVSGLEIYEILGK
jgi:hypothetical protein